MKLLFSDVFVAVVVCGLLNPLYPKSDLQILLCLTPDDFTLSNGRRFYSKVKIFHPGKKNDFEKHLS